MLQMNERLSFIDSERERSGPQEIALGRKSRDVWRLGEIAIVGEKFEAVTRDKFECGILEYALFIVQNRFRIGLHFWAINYVANVT